ncbi:MAG: aminopeptidase P family protein [Lachnospiraceae bacterium]|nr:aminopeptidase P family protein [Lachnospiraceae bacterium]
MKRYSADEYVKRIEALRKEMITAGTEFYYVPGGDFHMSEYVCDHFKCREFLSGFDGSNGEMIISADGAYLWTDGRYFIQAAEQLEGTGIELMKMGEPGVPKISEFLKEHMNAGQTLGFDGRCVSGGSFGRLKEALAGKEISYKTDLDLVGNIWSDRPALPDGKAWLLEKRFTNLTRAEKLALVRQEMEKAECDVLIIASLDDIAWLYQFRGSDIEYNPVTLSYTVIMRDTATLYMSPGKATDIRAALENDGVTVRDYEDIFEDLGTLDESLTVWTDIERINVKVLDSIPVNANRILRWSPAFTLKGVKTETEVENERSAHITDGAALTKIICYLKGLHDSDELKEGKVTELSIASKLLGYRKEAEDFIEESFAPIIAAGPHGAIIHYEPDETTNVPLRDNDIVLMDTGAQYLRGTTDVTRTVVIGEPTEKMKTLYTAVLKGNIALSSAVFKKGTSGRRLDILARKPLWELGYDYNHGTGHGVGFLLNVHEGPQNISSGPSGMGDTPFVPGMITSDEPGVYLEGEFGIRTENMIVCVPKDSTEFGDFYGFEVLTLVPFDRDLIDTEMLTEEEIRIIDGYHRCVYEELCIFMDENERKWLAETTRPLIDF